MQKKLRNTLVYLNKLGIERKVLVRINSMQECEYILGSKFKAGVPKRIGNLTIYVDSMNLKSQDNTHQNFDCILVYPIGSLKGIEDKNINDILNYRKSKKIFWISNHDNYDYTYLMDICNIKDIIKMDNSDEAIHNRITSNTHIIKRQEFDKLYVDNLSYHNVEAAINSKYKLGGIHTSSMGQELLVGSFDEYIF